MRVSGPLDLVEEALTAVSRHPAGDLNRGYREAIWASLGPRDRETGRPGPGHRRRGLLAIETCRHVLGLWEEERPGDDEPHELLELAAAALEGSAEREDALARAGMLWAHVDNLVVTAGREARLLVGYCAAKALLVALDDEQYDPDDIDLARTDFGRDPKQLDCAAIAAAAAASGFPWDERSDASARRDFWRWWLGEAVPRAWLTVDDET